VSYDPYSIPFLEPKKALPLQLTTKAGTFEFVEDPNFPENRTVSGKKAHSEVMRLLAVVGHLTQKAEQQEKLIRQLREELNEPSNA